MIKLSTKGRYGLRAMIELADNHGGKALMMSAIAAHQDISRKYLHALLTSLKDAGLVRAVRGARGGFLLAREPSQIRVSDIFESLEGRLSVVDCVTDETVCDRREECLAWGFWKRLNDAMADVLDNTTLADLSSQEGSIEGVPACAKTDRKRRRAGKRA